MANCFITRRGGNGAAFYAAIGITFPKNSYLTCVSSDGTVSLQTEVLSTENWIFLIPKEGTYTITATQGSYSAYKTISITKQNQCEAIRLSYNIIAYAPKDDGSQWYQYRYSGGSFSWGLEQVVINSGYTMGGYSISKMYYRTPFKGQDFSKVTAITGTSMDAYGSPMGVLFGVVKADYLSTVTSGNDFPTWVLSARCNDTQKATYNIDLSSLSPDETYYLVVAVRGRNLGSDSVVKPNIGSFSSIILYSNT